MKLISTLLLALPFTLSAQTIHIVDVGGFGNDTPLPYYSPNVLTIIEGDIVRWSNSSGTHNVNGTAQLFPDNPEGFYNAQPANGTWTWSYTFTIPGTYHYQCDSKGHADTQTGTIIVEASNSVGELRDSPAIVLFPSPALDVLKADVGDRRIIRAEIFAMDGRLVTSPSFERSDILVVPVQDLSAGNYLLRLTEASGAVSSHPFNKR